MDAWVSLHRTLIQYQDITIMLGRIIKVLLHEDRQRRASEPGVKVECLIALDPLLVKKVCVGYGDGPSIPRTGHHSPLATPQPR